MRRGGSETNWSTRRERKKTKRRGREREKLALRKKEDENCLEVVSRIENKGDYPKTPDNPN